MEQSYIKIIITIILALIGWIIVHRFTSKRDLNNKRREIRLNYLIESYSILTKEIAQRNMTNENKIKLENLLSDIQLYGTKEQVLLSNELALIVAKGEKFDLDILVKSLRNELRKELDLESIDEDIIWLRFNI